MREVLADSELSATVRVFCVATTHSYTTALARLAGHVIPDRHSFIASCKFLHDLFTARRSSTCLVVMHDFYLCHSQTPSAFFSGRLAFWPNLSLECHTFRPISSPVWPITTGQTRRSPGHGRFVPSLLRRRPNYEKFTIHWPILFVSRAYLNTGRVWKILPQ